MRRTETALKYLKTYNIALTETYGTFGDAERAGKADRVAINPLFPQHTSNCNCMMPSTIYDVPFSMLITCIDKKDYMRF